MVWDLKTSISSHTVAGKVCKILWYSILGKKQYCATPLHNICVAIQDLTKFNNFCQALTLTNLVSLVTNLAKPSLGQPSHQPDKIWVRLDTIIKQATIRKLFKTRNLEFLLSYNSELQRRGIDWHYNQKATPGGWNEASYNLNLIFV